MSIVKDVKIGRHKNLLTIDTPYQLKGLCQAIPDYRKWNKTLKMWVARPSVPTVVYMTEVFRSAEWSPEAMELVAEAMVIQERAEELRAERKDVGPDPEVVDYIWEGVPSPFAHQKRGFLLSRDEVAYALLMEQGTGKTKIAIDTVAWWHMTGKANALFVVAPNGVKDVWAEEIEDHLPTTVDREVRVWDSKLGKRALEELKVWIKVPSPGLKVFIVNVEGLSTKRAQGWATEFLTWNRCLMVVDESTRIKTPGAKRTKAIIKLGKMAKARRILTGTPVTKNPLDLFTQFGFLDQRILGYTSFYAFRNRYAVMGGYERREIQSFINLDELKETISPHSFRVLSEECQDLPPKVYQRIDVDLTSEQRRIYNELKTNLLTEYAGQTISVTLAMTLYMRLQQIAGGFVSVLSDEALAGNYVPSTDKYVSHRIEGGNPKLDALGEFVEGTDEKVIVWARFRPELELIADTLREQYGPRSVAEFHGGVDNKTRTANRRAFQDPASSVRFFVGNPATGGLGITLTAAPFAFYFSNSFDLEERLQSEKRPHRHGQTKTVVFVDAVARDTVEEKIRKTLLSKKSLADMITGDAWTAWL